MFKMAKISRKVNKFDNGQTSKLKTAKFQRKLIETEFTGKMQFYK